MLKLRVVTFFNFRMNNPLLTKIRKISNSDQIALSSNGKIAEIGIRLWLLIRKGDCSSPVEKLGVMFDTKWISSIALFNFEGRVLVVQFDFLLFLSRFCVKSMSTSSLISFWLCVCLSFYFMI